MRQLILLLALIGFGTTAYAEEAGRVVFVAGQAQVAAHPAALEQAVQEGDELSTGPTGYIYMKTVDNGFLILRPNSRARVAAYHVDHADPSQTRVKLELLSGVARSISGTAVKKARQNFRFNTPVAAIGVRGTDFIVYTNQQSSWVSVVSGGVVVSGFAGACGPEGGGPCEGAASRELFAGRPDVMLQVQRGQNVPQLLQGASVAPELNVPARPDEPVGKVSSTLNKGTMGDVNLDVAKSTAPVLSKPVVITPPVVVSPPPVVVVEPDQPHTPDMPAPPEIIWGRWETVASNNADTEVVKKVAVVSNKNKLVYGSYVIARPDNSSFVLPREGTVGFSLAGSEATLSRADGPVSLAAVKNASLTVDFGARTFATALSVYNNLGQLDLNGKGEVTQTGRLEGSINDSTVLVKGILGGASATEAVYAFKSLTAGPLTATGLTRWSR